MDRTSYFHFTP
jgi:hypothetical protein